jgi:hypothetical protein
VKNVLAAGSFEVVTQRRTYRLVEPELFVDKQQSQVPFIVRLMLKQGNVTEFISTKIDTSTEANT